MNQHQFCGVEALEDRRLMSATLAPAAKLPPIPNVVGIYVGTLEYSTGLVDTLTLQISRQRGSTFAGDSFQGSGSQSHFTGTVTRKGAVSVIAHGTNVKFTSVSKGTVANQVLYFRFNTVEGRYRFHGIGQLTSAT